MREYALLFRMDIATKSAQPSKEQMEVYMHQWMEWLNCISGKGQLADGGNHFSREGRLLKARSKMIENPYISESVSVAGYIIIKAKDLNDATEIAKNCPILNGENTSVEIRGLAAAGE